MKALIFFCLLIFLQKACPAQSLILTGAEQTVNYFKLVSHKHLGMVVNAGSRIGNTHLVDTLLNAGMKIEKIFAPEHGFRGTADAGESVENTVDKSSGIPVISLYGKHTRPTASDLQDIDLMVFDLQDVGARFYTYLSTLHEVMKACSEQHIPLLVLDRPNPNGFCIDGPILDTVNCRSFVGIDPVPVVYGMTIGEYARMVNGEGWLGKAEVCKLNVITLKNYTHKSLYHLPLPPSPNLPTDLSIALYPSLCFFEGTVISVARGTNYPFQAFGHPDLPSTAFSFIPVPIEGKSKHPPLENKTCNGTDLRGYNEIDFLTSGQLNMTWLISTYRAFPDKNKFFNNYFEKLAGTLTLRKQLIAGNTEAQIRDSWQAGLNSFKLVRKKYLLYAE